jgi:hypothetical protein
MERYLERDALIGPNQKVIAFGVSDLSAPGFFVEYFEKHVPARPSPDHEWIGHKARRNIGYVSRPEYRIAHALR